MKIGWVGLGRIGLPMALRLAQAGHEVVAWRRADRAFTQAVPAPDATQVGSSAPSPAVDVVVLCLPSAEAIDEVVFGDQGAGSQIAQGGLIVDHSTMAPAQTRLWSRRAKDVGLDWVDMPVSGGVDAAGEGRLVAWAGGDGDAVTAAMSLAAAYCGKIVRAGDSGAGQLIKACNQMIVGTTVAAWSQMLALAQAAGLEPDELVGMLEGGSADSRIAHTFGLRLATGSFPAPSLANFSKDLKIISEIGMELGVAAPMVEAALAELGVITPAR